METEASKLDADVERVKDLTKKVSELLAGAGREVQAMVLTDAIAMWIAGHFGPEEDVLAFRLHAMERFMKQIWRLIPVNAALMKEAMTESEKAEYAAAMAFVQSAKARKH